MRAGQGRLARAELGLGRPLARNEGKKVHKTMRLFPQHRGEDEHSVAPLWIPAEASQIEQAKRLHAYPCQGLGRAGERGDSREVGVAVAGLASVILTSTDSQLLRGVADGARGDAADVDVLPAEVNRVVARQLGHVHGATDVIGGELARDGLALGEDRAAAAVVTCHVGVAASSRLLGTLPPPLLVVIALMLKVSSSSKWSLSPPSLSVGSQNCLMSASVQPAARLLSARIEQSSPY
jgi:hypothetical protein